MCQWYKRPKSGRSATHFFLTTINLKAKPRNVCTASYRYLCFWESRQMLVFLKKRTFYLDILKILRLGETSDCPKLIKPLIAFRESRQMLVFFKKGLFTLTF